MILKNIPPGTSKDVIQLAEMAMNFLMPPSKLLEYAETLEPREELGCTAMAFELYAEMYRKTQRHKLNKKPLEQFKIAMEREAKAEWGDQAEVLFFKNGTVSVSHPEKGTRVFYA